MKGIPNPSFELCFFVKFLKIYQIKFSPSIFKHLLSKKVKFNLIPNHNSKALWDRHCNHAFLTKNLRIQNIILIESRCHLPSCQKAKICICILHDASSLIVWRGLCVQNSR